MTPKPRAAARLLLGFLALSGWTSLEGQTVPSPYRFIETRHEAGVFVARMSPETGVFDYGPGPGIATGGRYGFRFAGAFGMEATIAYLPTQRSLIDPGRDEGDRKIGEVSADLLAFDARFRFSLTGDRTWKGLNPFVLVGVGAAMDLAGEDPREEELLADDRFKFGVPVLGAFGGGIAWLPTERLLIRSDLGITLWQIRAPRGYRDPTRGLVGVEKREWVGGPSISLGAAYRF